MSFSLDLSKFIQKTEKKTEQVIKKVFIDLSTDIIKDTPVATGRAKNNWFPDVNKFSSEKTIINDKTGRISTVRITSSANSYKLGDTLTFSNNLPYTVDLEYGKSKQAPSGMVRKNIMRWKSIVEKEARKV